MVTLEEVVYNSVRIKSGLLPESEQGALVVDKIHFKARSFWHNLVLYRCPLIFSPFPFPSVSTNTVYFDFKLEFEVFIMLPMTRLPSLA